MRALLAAPSWGFSRRKTVNSLLDLRSTRGPFLEPGLTEIEYNTLFFAVGGEFGLEGFGALFGAFGSFFGTFAEIVDKLDEHKNTERDKNEVDDALDEFAVSDRCGADGNRKGGEVNAAEDETDSRHNNIINEGGDDGGESAPNSDTYGEVENVAAVDKFAEFFIKRTAFGAKFLQIF